MDPNLYQQIKDYLENQAIPSDRTTTATQKSFKNFCKVFELKNNYLYRRDKRKNGNLLRVIRRYEMEPVLYMTHNDPTAAHFGIEIMFNKIRDRYFWPKMYEDIRNYVKSCDACQ